MPQENANSLQTGRPWYFRFMRQWLFKLGTDKVATGITDPTQTKVAVYLGDKAGDYRFGQLTLDQLGKAIQTTTGNVAPSGQTYGAVTGTVSRAVYTVHTAVAASVGYVQAEATATETALAAVSARLGALITDLKIAKVIS